MIYFKNNTLLVRYFDHAIKVLVIKVIILMQENMLNAMILILSNKHNCIYMVLDNGYLNCLN